MKKLSEFIKESLNESKDYKSRDMAIEKLKSAGINVKGGGASAYAEIDGKKYAIKAHVQPLKNNCLIVDYGDLADTKFAGFLFINPMTDYQDVAYAIPTSALKNYIDSNLDKKNGMWPTKASEKTVYGDNQNFFGVTLTIDDLKKNVPEFEEISIESVKESLSDDKKKIKKYFTDPENRKKFIGKYNADKKMITDVFDWLTNCVDTMKDSDELIGFLSDNDASENGPEMMEDDYGHSEDEVEAVEWRELFSAIADDLESL